MDVEVDRAGAWSSVPVQSAWQIALAPDRQHHLERPVAEAVVVDPVGEGDRLLRDVPADDARHRPARALEQRVAGALKRLRPEALADLDDPPLRRAAAADDRHQVAPVRIRRPRVVEDHVERRSLRTPRSKILIGGIRSPSSQIESASDGLAARGLAADVHHVAEERGEPDPLALEEDRQDHEPVVAVRDRPLAEDTGRSEDHVALADLAAEAVDRHSGM